MSKRYSHAYTIAFSVVTRDAEGVNVPLEWFRNAILKRLASCTDDELMEAIGPPFDSYAIDEDCTSA